MPFGAVPLQSGGARFRLWAPDARRVDLLLDTDAAQRTVVEMPRTEGGWFEHVDPGARPGDMYRYRIDDEIEVPDPAARAAPRGIEGGCELVDPQAFVWPDSGWRGRPWHEAIVYELHVGTFTAEGTFAAAAARFPELAADGFTAIELMPVGAFPGERGWGYDGVLPFSPHAAYGRPEQLKALVAAAHAAGLMVLLDVVYNHFGPRGNYLGRYARAFFTSAYRTPWGDAVNLAHPVVRDYFLHNARYWLEEYRFDGLRIDAVHAMRDDSPRHFVVELADGIRLDAGREGFAHCVLENVDNRSRYLEDASRAPAGFGLAQWNDDFHHALHVLLTGERDGYYVDFSEEPVAQLGRVLAEGFAFQGAHSVFAGRARGEPSGQLSPAAFVAFLQTHDQVGNRAFGERLAQLTGPGALRAALTTLLLAPQIPMLFMGEEYAAPQPFLYFCDYTGELAATIAAGRRREFARFTTFASAEARERIPDPCAPQTCAASRLCWSDRARPGHAEWLALVRRLLSVRATSIVPLIPRIVPGSGASHLQGATVLQVEWQVRDGGWLRMLGNFGAAETADPPDAAPALFETHARARGRLAPWEVRWTLSPS